MFQSTKTYGHDLGLSCVFRQWRAESHCRKLHGYALSVKLTFNALSLDENGWVMDFGALKPVKSWLQDNFDHKLLVARDDPHLDEILKIHDKFGFADVVVLSRVGVEAFAYHIGMYVQQWLNDQPWNQTPDTYSTLYGRTRVHIASCEVAEHGANSAIWYYEG